jgi:hypothetical protein
MVVRRKIGDVKDGKKNSPVAYSETAVAVINKNLTSRS